LCWRIIERRTVQPDQLALATDTQHRMRSLNQRTLGFNRIGQLFFSGTRWVTPVPS
jgi:hypothetical protein